MSSGSHLLLLLLQLLLLCRLALRLLSLQRLVKLLLGKRSCCCICQLLNCSCLLERLLLSHLQRTTPRVTRVITWAERGIAGMCMLQPRYHNLTVRDTVLLPHASCKHIQS
jgi:hypothetical protein